MTHELVSQPTDVVAVGQVLGAHGRDGGLTLRVFSDVPGRFDSGQTLLIDGRSCTVSVSRVSGPNSRLLWLVGVSRREQAEALRGSWLYVPEKDVPAAEEGEFFHYQLLGMAVYTEEDELLGEIGEILETGSNDVYVVKGPSKELLVPATAQVVRQVDVSGRRMTVRLLDGMR